MTILIIPDEAICEVDKPEDKGRWDMLTVGEGERFEESCCIDEVTDEKLATINREKKIKSIIILMLTV